MTAPHMHTTKEVVDAIKKIGHNQRTGTDGATEGAPTGIMGSPSYNGTAETQGVTPKSKGDDWVGKRAVNSKK